MRIFLQPQPRSQGQKNEKRHAKWNGREDTVVLLSHWSPATSALFPIVVLASGVPGQTTELHASQCHSALPSQTTTAIQNSLSLPIRATLTPLQRNENGTFNSSICGALKCLSAFKLCRFPFAAQTIVALLVARPPPGTMLPEDDRPFDLWRPGYD